MVLGWVAPLHSQVFSTAECLPGHQHAMNICHVPWHSQSIYTSTTQKKTWIISNKSACVVCLSINQHQLKQFFGVNVSGQRVRAVMRYDCLQKVHIKCSLYRFTFGMQQFCMWWGNRHLPKKRHIHQPKEYPCVRSQGLFLVILKMPFTNFLLVSNSDRTACGTSPKPCSSLSSPTRCRCCMKSRCLSGSPDSSSNNP